MICPDYPTPQFLIMSDKVPSLLYYSHIPTIIITLLLGFFVYFKNKHSLASKVLLSVSVVFSLWVFLNLIAWTANDSQIISFIFPFFSILYTMLCMLCLYFVYVFIEKKDVSFNIKLIFGTLLLPVIFFAPTEFSFYNFSLPFCGIIDEGFYFSTYYYGVSFLVFVWLLFFIISRYRKTEEKNEKKQIALIGIGMGAFLLSFFATGYLASLLVNSYDIEFYGLFFMTFFMGVLTYIIVKFKAFNIKMIGAQVLVVSLVLLVGSQFFFIQTNTNKVLTGITLIFVGIFGIFLMRSIKAEVQRKEELQYMSDRLAEANDKLRKLDNAKSEFISIASHQLRTPLTAIKGFISLLNEGSYGQLAPEQADVLKKVFISNERLINLVEDLLNISRIESGRMEFKFESCQLTDLCKELFDTFTFKAKDANLYLDFKIPENVLPEVFIDRAKVREVLSNLIDNAIKYTPKGGVSVRLERVFAQNSKIPNVSEKGSVKIIVSDTGIGIPAEEIPYLFSKFSRGKDTSRLNVSGTGLGLYVGKSMIEANGGKIWIESDGAGLGSRFIVEVPVEQTQENLTRWS